MKLRESIVTLSNIRMAYLFGDCTESEFHVAMIDALNACPWRLSGVLADLSDSARASFLVALKIAARPGCNMAFSSGRVFSMSAELRDEVCKVAS